MFEILTGSPMSWRAQVIEPGSALRIDYDTLFDLLADNVDLLQGIFSALLQAESSEPVAAVKAGGM